MPKLFIKNPGPYNGITCRHLDNATGKCALEIEFIKDDLHSCSVGFTYCPQWSDSGFANYAYNSHYEQFDDLTWIPLSYHAIEVLKDNPNYLQLEWK